MREVARRVGRYFFLDYITLSIEGIIIAFTERLVILRDKSVEFVVGILSRKVSVFGYLTYITEINKKVWR